MRKGSTTIMNEEAVATLRRLFPTTPADDIAKEIGCSDTTVLIWARRLGLQRDPSFHRNNFIGRYVHKGRYNIYKK